MGNKKGRTKTRFFRGTSIDRAGFQGLSYTHNFGGNDRLVKPDQAIDGLQTRRDHRNFGNAIGKSFEIGQSFGHNSSCLLFQTRIHLYGDQAFPALTALVQRHKSPGHFGHQTTLNQGSRLIVVCTGNQDVVHHRQGHIMTFGATQHLGGISGIGCTMNGSGFDALTDILSGRIVDPQPGSCLPNDCFKITCLHIILRWDMDWVSC